MSPDQKGHRKEQESSASWYELFDRICIDQGHFNNADLAAEYCKVIRRSNQTAYDTAIRNIRNWRNGKHTPSPRNFRILTSILRIDEGHDLFRSWQELYELESVNRNKNISNNNDFYENGIFIVNSRSYRIFNFQNKSFRNILLFLFSCSLVISVSFLFFDLKFLSPKYKFISASAESLDMTGKLIQWREYTRLSVGQSAVIHGKRGRCGQNPPEWAEVMPLLPRLDVGKWSDGGIGYRESNACQGPTPARAVIFTAVKSGGAEFLLFHDKTKIEVQK